MNILDKRFKYVPAAKTDLEKTFKRVRAELKAKAEREQQIQAEATAKVRQMARK
jgi:DNA-directed RNA polymerase sigma subunit (sigma70/sigma32)